MASRFGGIPVTAEAGSRFGGVPIEQPAPTQAPASVQPSAGQAESFTVKGLREIDEQFLSESTFQPTEATSRQVGQTRKRTVRTPATKIEDTDEFLFRGLSPEVVKSITDASTSFTDARGRRTDKGKVNKGRLEKAANFERLRTVNPDLAEMIDDLGGVESFLIGAGKGLTTIGRGLSRPFVEQEDRAFEDLAAGAVTERRGAAAAGEIVGEAAPFLPLGLAASAPKAIATRALAGGTTGAIEGATITAGKGGTGKEIVESAILGGVTLGVGEAAAPLLSGVGRKSLKESAKEGRKLLEPTKKQVAGALAEAAPTTTQLRDASKAIYKSIKEKGGNISEGGVNRLATGILEGAQEFDFVATKAGRALTPESTKIIDLVDELKDLPIVGVADIERVRRSAQNSAGVAARAGNNQDAAISGAIVDGIDEFLGTVKTTDISSGVKNVGAELATARKLWGRARRQELLDEALEVGEARAAGAERGMRNEFNKILNNKKKAKFFTAAEKEAMRVVVKGTPSANTFRRLGQFGFGKGQQTNVLGGLAGAGVGSTTLSAAFGPLGAGIGLVLLPTIGTISKTFAEKLTRNNARLAGQVVRAGSDGDKITQAYLRNTPVDQRSADELGQLLMRNDIDIGDLRPSEIVNEAVTIAVDLRSRLARQVAAAAPVAAIPAVAAEEEQQ